MTSTLSGPWFEDLELGLDFSAPGVTLTDGLATLHQAAFGDRLRLCLDHHLCRQVTGQDSALVNPMLLCNLTIGQTTWASQRVLGNLFYRGLLIRKPVFLGDTLRTCSRVVARRQNRRRQGRAASGMVVLEIEARNQRDELIMQFWRCPMVPCRDPEAETGCADDLQAFPALREDEFLQAVPDWDLTRLPVDGPGFADLQAGEELLVEAVDTVTLAPEVVRATLNLAMTHLDAEASLYGKRLVYGGHTISLAAAQVSRALPNLVTHLAWQHCNHTGPVFEGDRLQTRVRLLGVQPLDTGGLLHLQVITSALRNREPEPVLDWEFRALSA